jgi:hypothetical protein
MAARRLLALGCGNLKRGIDQNSCRPGWPPTTTPPSRIRSPATGAEHRVRINLPNGIEFDIAEIGSGTTKTMTSIALDLKDTYCHFTHLRQSGKGVVRSR